MFPSLSLSEYPAHKHETRMTHIGTSSLGNAGPRRVLWTYQALLRCSDSIADAPWELWNDSRLLKSPQFPSLPHMQAHMPACSQLSRSCVKGTGSVAGICRLPLPIFKAHLKAIEVEEMTRFEKGDLFPHLRPFDLRSVRPDLLQIRQAGVEKASSTGSQGRQSRKLRLYMLE